jgi:CBS domain-containing protein
MSAGQICSRTVVTALSEEFVRVAARRMAEHSVGTVIVVNKGKPDEPVGIVTDRDIVIRCVAGSMDPDTTPVSKIMTQPLRAIDENAPLEDVILRMNDATARRLVVTGKKGQMVGVLSLDDVVGVLIDELQPIGRLLERQEPQGLS